MDSGLASSRAATPEPARSTRLIGRESEQAAVNRVLASVRDGRSEALVLRGEAGIGKTVLLDAAVEAAADLLIVRLVGIESEMRLGFAGLHQLLMPYLGDIDALPPQQVGALKAALALSNDQPPDPFLVGLALLTLLAHVATRRDILVVADDAQWLDQESADALGFVARRLDADRIGVLVSVREPSERLMSFDGLPSVRLGPLSDEASVSLIESTVERSIASHVRDRIIADAQGNPLAIVELSKGLSTDQLSGTAALPEPLAVGDHLEARFLRQVRALPAQTQEFLLVAAAEPTGDLALVWRAGRALDFDERAIAPAEGVHLVNVGDTVGFRHPLIRSAVYHGVGAADRRRVHEALAAATDVDRDPDRRAWHRAAATVMPDEDVAVELEQAANRARTHGGYAATSALLTRAAQLTPDAGARALRYFAAAVADLDAGASARAYENLKRAIPDLEDDFLAAQARRLEAAIIFIDIAPRGGSSGIGRTEEIASIMLDAAANLAAVDIRSARETLLDAMLMAIYFGDASATRASDVALAAKSVELASFGAPTSSDFVLDAFAELFANGYDDAVPLLRRALDALVADPESRESPRRFSFGCWLGFALSDDNAVKEVGDECVSLCRTRSAFQVLPEALNYLGQWALRLGSLTAADAYFSEGEAIQAMADRSGIFEADRVVVSAWRGRDLQVRTDALRLRVQALEAGVGLVVELVDYAVTLLELGLGNYIAAAAAARANYFDDVALGPFRAVDLIEAHVRGGDRAAAVAAVEWLRRRAVANKTAIDRGLASRGQALISDNSEAEAHFREALTYLEASGATLHVARTQLLYGEWLRRVKRRRDARVQLEAALETFESLGADAFAERARVELLATGATARKRVDETRNTLTPQEAQVARLAAGGATNAEIAERLFVSTSTVDYHLRKVYRKLEIASRHELARTDFTWTR
jgi:DNA-binding CsgD family transcriptional regulator